MSGSAPGVPHRLLELIVNRSQSAEARTDGSFHFTFREQQQQQQQQSPYDFPPVPPQQSSQQVSQQVSQHWTAAPPPHHDSRTYQQPPSAPALHGYGYSYGYNIAQLGPAQSLYTGIIPGHYQRGLLPASHHASIPGYGTYSEHPSMSMTAAHLPRQAYEQQNLLHNHTPVPAALLPQPALTTPPTSVDGTGVQALSEWEQELAEKLSEHTKVVASLMDNLDQQLLNPEIHGTNTWHEHNVRQMRALLRKSGLAEPGAGTCARWGTGQDVVDNLRSNPSTRQVLFFRDAETKNIAAGRTILSELGQKLQHNPGLRLSVQVPEREFGRTDSCAMIPGRDILQLFQNVSTSCMPRNMLSFVMHDTSSVQPSFIAKLGSDLLTHIREKHMRKSNSISKDPPLWGTFAQSTTAAGAISLPHIDRDGMDTFLICVQGRQVFTFADEHTPEQFEAFCSRSPREQSDMGIKWRTCVLSPGEGVFMPAGTPHAVARLPGGEHSMTFGGHILRASQISRFAQLCRLQMESPHVTNEHETSTSVPYLIEVGKIVKAAEINRDPTFPDKFGGIEEVRSFWETLQAIDERLSAQRLMEIRNIFLFRPAKPVKRSQRA